MSTDFIAGIGLTRLTVYEQRPAPDGIHSGCAHVHACTDEAYYVVSGTGAIELNDLESGYRRVPLAPGDYVQFPPGTLHRSISTGALEVLAVLGNAGLAEHGDARIYFGAEVDADPAEFARLVALPKTHGLEGALARRDASVRAYTRLLALWRDDRDAYFAELERFIAVHRAAIAPRRDEFARIVADGPARWVARAEARVQGLAAADTAKRTVAADATPALGMCGTLAQLRTLGPA